MSKKNNKGSKKKNNRNNYKIESLEPRLLMCPLRKNDAHI